MLRTLPFNDHVREYEEWFDKYPAVFESEVEAIRRLLPRDENIRGLEIGVGTGRFSKALGIKEGIEPAPNMRAFALKRGIDVIAGEIEHLPYYDMTFDFILMVSCISYFEDLHTAFAEAKRVLKTGGAIIVGFIERDSEVGKLYQQRKARSVFYKEARFYTTKTVMSELSRLGFKDFEFFQTLFHPLDEITKFESPRHGFGKGSFIVIRAIKQEEIGN